MYHRYRAYCEQGSYKPGMVYAYQDPRSGRWIYNLATQDYPGPRARLEWIEKSLAKAAAHAREHGVETIALPRIGSGIGGLRWEEVEEVIKAQAQKEASPSWIVYVID
jgi:O-acetyl-ADP-ribose deacetylase (regulator of RNase III)